MIVHNVSSYRKVKFIDVKPYIKVTETSLRFFSGIDDEDEFSFHEGPVRDIEGGWFHSGLLPIRDRRFRRKDLYVSKRLKEIMSCLNEEDS